MSPDTMLSGEALSKSRPFAGLLSFADVVFSPQDLVSQVPLLISDLRRTRLRHCLSVGTTSVTKRLREVKEWGVEHGRGDGIRLGDIARHEGIGQPVGRKRWYGSASGSSRMETGRLHPR